MLSNDYHSRSRSNSVGCRAQSIYDYTYDIDFTFPYISAINPQKSATAAAKIITRTATYIFNTTSDNEAWLPHVMFAVRALIRSRSPSFSRIISIVIEPIIVIEVDYFGAHQLFIAFIV